MRSSVSLAYTLLCSLVATPLASAQQPFTLETLRRVVSVGGVELSPDGRTAVISVTRPNYDSDRNESELFAVDVASGATRQLTFERRAVGGAHFSPDGQTLAFLSPDAQGTSQIWLMPMSASVTVTTRPGRSAGTGQVSREYW